ncbi:MAG: hypothetical protein IH851_10715 [Armatimonadetes bacterium]|nr:hypothetical protein [Armatimonadota bacterium]
MLRIAIKSVMFLAVLTLVVTIPVYQSYASRAQLIQRVEVDEASFLLLGEPGTFIGSPQMMIIDDSGAFIEGEGPEGARLVNDIYLRENGIYPLQLKTVGFVMGLARWVSGGAIALALGGLWFLRRREVWRARFSLSELSTQVRTPSGT